MYFIFLYFQLCGNLHGTESVSPSKVLVSAPTSDAAHKTVPPGSDTTTATPAPCAATTSTTTHGKSRGSSDATAATSTPRTRAGGLVHFPKRYKSEIKFIVTTEKPNLTIAVDPCWKVNEIGAASLRSLRKVPSGSLPTLKKLKPFAYLEISIYVALQTETGPLFVGVEWKFGEWRDNSFVLVIGQHSKLR
ncbi:hypothetical protein AVEN_70533-1, partial [Araneus ventricosus]